MPRENAPATPRPGILCGFSRRQGLMRIATVSPFVDGPMDAADCAVETRLTEDSFDYAVLEGVDETQRP